MEGEKKLSHIAKVDEEKQYVFGWANVAIRVNGEQIEDYQGDIIDPEVLEEAAYKFVEFYGDSGEMHNGKGAVARVIESVMFTKEKQAAIGIPDGVVPEGWWIGVHVLDDDVWEKVKSGEYSMFSIEGEAIREEVE